MQFRNILTQRADVTCTPIFIFKEMRAYDFGVPHSTPNSHMCSVKRPFVDGAAMDLTKFGLNASYRAPTPCCVEGILPLLNQLSITSS
jgi:hypothetical protein